MVNPVIIFGTGTIGKTALDIFKKNDVVVYGFLDDNVELHSSEINEVIVLGSTDDEGITKLIGKKCDAFVAIDDNKFRKTITNMLHDRRHIMPINAIHKNAILATNCNIGHGNLIAAGVIVNTGADISHHCLLNTRVTIDCDAKIADFVQIGVGAIIGAEVEIGEGAFVGAGAIVVQGIKIGKNARIGAGSIVIADVASGKTVFGNPAKEI